MPEVVGVITAEGAGVETVRIGNKVTTTTILAMMKSAKSSSQALESKNPLCPPSPLLPQQECS